MIRYCPHCDKRYVVDSDVSDYIHTCFGTAVLSQDDKVVVGNWDDGNGQIGSKSAQAVMMQGAENKSFGARPEVKQEEQDTQTRLGNRASTHRQKQHSEFINIKGEGFD